MKEITFDIAINKVYAIDLSDISFFLTEYDGGPRLLPPYVESAIHLYRMFLVIKKVRWTQRLVPSEPVDEVWHTHILMTKKYRHDCRLLFGRYLDHDPMYGSRSWEERQVYNRDKGITIRLLQTYFGLTEREYTLGINSDQAARET